MRILLKNGRVIDPKNHLDEILDVYIEDGVISEIGPNLDYTGNEIDEIDVTGKIVAPGLIDMHCHLRDPGLEYKEDIESGTKAAVTGGFTSVACMPNTNPVIDHQAVVKYIIEKAKELGYANVYPIGSISKGLKGEQLSEIGELKFAGVVGISDDGRPVSNSSLMRRAMDYAAMFGVPVISHCEELSLLDGGVMNEGLNSTLMGLRGITRAAEEVMIARDIILAETDQKPIHIAHVSTRGGIEWIRQAKKRGVAVTCETCPHYFSLTDDAVSGFNTMAKVNPPLRTQDDVEAVIEGLQDGTIDVIATDHAPHHKDEKMVEFDLAANGISGFETALAVGLTYLVKRGKLTIAELLDKMTYQPANILCLNKGCLDVGKPADIVVFDPNETFIVDPERFQSKGKNTPFAGQELEGVVYYTIVNGKIVVREKILL